MEELEFLKKLDRVSAPPDFEQRLMARLARMKKAKTAAPALRPRVWLAAASAALLAVAVLVNVFILRQPAGVNPAGSAQAAEAIPIMEPLDYRQDSSSLSEEPGTIYLLENVSNETFQEIRY